VALTWDEDRLQWTGGPAIANVTGTADLTFSQNEVDLINGLTATVNTLLQVLREAGVIALD
jgi:hypothetical protein